MTELKTLKDLKVSSKNPMFNMGADDQRKYLRIEAIRHLKFQGDKLKRFHKSGMEMDVYATDVLRKWIAKFFNVDGGFSK